MEINQNQDGGISKNKYTLKTHEIIVGGKLNKKATCSEAKQACSLKGAIGDVSIKS